MSQVSLPERKFTSEEQEEELILPPTFSQPHLYAKKIEFSTLNPKSRPSIAFNRGR